MKGKVIKKNVFQKLWMQIRNDSSEQQRYGSLRREREREKLRGDATRMMVYIFDLITRCLRVINEVEN